MALLKETLEKSGVGFASYFAKQKESEAQKHAQRMANKYAMPKIPKTEMDVEEVQDWWRSNMALIGATSTRAQKLNKQYVVTVLIDEQDMDCLIDEDWQLDLVNANEIQLYEDEYENENKTYEEWFLGRYEKEKK